MTRLVAMIPARLGSKRVRKKNLRMLGDKPLIAHTIETALASKVFDEVYVNSEADIFGRVAERYGAKFYKRPPKFATDDATNDQFALDFMEHVPCDVLVQLNPTSPFVSCDDMRRAAAMFTSDGADTVLTVKEIRIEGLLNGRPLNFDPTQQMPPSQDLTPLFVFCNGILAWRTDAFRRSMAQFGCAVYGGKGNTKYCVLDGDAALDIDNDADFRLAECVLESRQRQTAVPAYWDELDRYHEHAESDVPSILVKDGVAENDLHDANHPVTSIEEMLNRGSHDVSWSKRIINSPSNSVTIISQLPGEGNRRHYHADWDEWWLILEGEWIYEIEGREHPIKKGDVVFIERNKLHMVTASGAGRAVRMAVSRADVAHIYPDEAAAHRSTGK